MKKIEPCPFKKKALKRCATDRSLRTPHTHLSDLSLPVSDRATNLLATTHTKRQSACVRDRPRRRDDDDDDDAYLYCTVIRRCWRVAVIGGFQLRLRAHT